MKAILKKSNFNPKELLSSFQKDWEILPFPQVVAQPKKPQEWQINNIIQYLKTTMVVNDMAHLYKDSKTEY